METQKNNLKFLSVLAGIVLVGFFYFHLFPTPKAKDSPEPAVSGITSAQSSTTEERNPRLKDNATKFQTEALAVVALDLRTGTTLYEKNPSAPWPPASLSKLMTAVVLASIVSGSTAVEVAKEDLKVSAPTMGLIEGEKITVLDLLKGMLIPSANDAALTLSRAVTGSNARFVEFMNLMAVQLGLENSNFKNPAGFDEEGQYTTAEDIGRLTFEFLKHEQLAHIVQIQTAKVSSVDGQISHYLKTSNKLLEQKNILGVKTGYTEKARGNLVLLASDENNNQILTVVLGSQNREEESLRLISWVFENYEF